MDYRQLATGLLFVLLQVPSTRGSRAAEDWVEIAPVESNEILSNPGMGWETFHTTANADRNLPAWIPSTVHYGAGAGRSWSPHGRAKREVP